MLVNAYVKVQKFYEECTLKNRTFMNNKTQLSILVSYMRNSDTDWIEGLLVYYVGYFRLIEDWKMMDWLL